MSESYSSKLRDPRWQKKRLEILERDNFMCRVCSDKDDTLFVHHLSYDKEPWTVPDESLVTLCEFCHNQTEAMIKRVRGCHPVHAGIFNLVCELLERPGSECLWALLTDYRDPHFVSVIDAISSLCQEQRWMGLLKGKEIALETTGKE